MARPTKYSKSILAKAAGYIETYEQHGDAIPSIEGLSVVLGVNRSTIYEWRTEHKEFSDMLESLLSAQARKLMNGGLTGDFQPTIAKLVLAKHGYHDKQDTEISGGVEVRTIERRIVHAND
jgi:hypothetical protein